MERPGGELPPRARSQFRRVLFLLESGAVHLFRRLREGSARQHLFRGRALLDRFPRLYGGGRLRRRARCEGDPGAAEQEVGAEVGAPSPDERGVGARGPSERLRFNARENGRKREPLPARPRPAGRFGFSGLAQLSGKTAAKQRSNLPLRRWDYPRRRLILPPPFGRASPPPQLCGPMSASVGLRGRVDGRLAARPKGRSPE